MGLFWYHRILPRAHTMWTTVRLQPSLSPVAAAFFLLYGDARTTAKLAHGCGGCLYPMQDPELNSERVMAEPDVTALFRAWSQGDTSARDNLVPRVYRELRRRRQRLRRTRARTGAAPIANTNMLAGSGTGTGDSESTNVVTGITWLSNGPYKKVLPTLGRVVHNGGYCRRWLHRTTQRRAETHRK
jgi:hypothetical protein